MSTYHQLSQEIMGLCAMPLRFEFVCDTYHDRVYDYLITRPKDCQPNANLLSTIRSSDSCQQIEVERGMVAKNNSTCEPYT